MRTGAKYLAAAAVLNSLICLIPASAWLVLTPQISSAVSSSPPHPFSPVDFVPSPTFDHRPLWPYTSCVPAGRVFSAPASANSIDENKKLSRQEFSRLPVTPSGASILPKGTELNVVVEIKCLHSAEPQKGAQRLLWLKKIAGSIIPVQGGAIRSMHWTLEEDWVFDVLQEEFELEPCVKMVSPEGRFFPKAKSNDPMLFDQSHLPLLHFEEAMDDFRMPLLTGHRPTIAIVDTGVDLSHTDLRFNRWINEKEVSGNQRDDDGNGYVDDFHGYNFSADSDQVGPQGDWADNRHGSHVAGLAASRIDNGVGGTGISGNARLMSLNVFGVNNYTRSSILENALRYAADRRADIINLSLGGREYSRTMRAALEYAVGRGSFIVSAAGNDGLELCENPGSFEFISPAVYGSTIDGMIVTASIDVANGQLSRFSNYSSRLVEIAAPGAFDSEGMMIGLLSTVPKNGYEKIAGTSMAAPVVSGAAALAVTWLKTYRYNVSPSRLESIMKHSARSEPALTSSLQFGRSLDLRALAQYLKSTYPPRTLPTNNRHL